MRVSRSSRRLDYSADLLRFIEEKFGTIEETQPLGEWVLSERIVLEGQPFSFDRHEYLWLPYHDDHPYIVEMKAAQMGCTTEAILKALYSCRYKGVSNLYLFPSRTDVLDFSKSRVSPLIEENPDSIGKWLKDTDAAGLKRVGNRYLYLRGMVSRVGLKSIPVGRITFDEIDEARQASVDLAMERMSHQEHREVLMLSNPSLPDFGIDQAFQQTDQRYWLLKCRKCNAYTCLEDEFLEDPTNILIEDVGKVLLCCPKCQARLNLSVGEWVAKKPSVEDKRGYHFSQLFSHYVDPAEILHQYRTTSNLSDFWNLKIGMAYVEAENRLAIELILTLCDSDGIASSDPGLCFMGVDQGKDLHVVISKKHPSKAGKIIHLGVYQDWTELDILMKNFNISRCVVDALPETRNARAFAEKNRGKVFLNFYQEHQKGSYRWNEKDLTVACNRTESLDSSHNEIINSQIILPKRCGVVEEFARHLHNVAKRLEEDEETGSKRYVYVKLGPDHFRHAFNYEAMARQSSPTYLFPEFRT